MKTFVNGLITLFFLVAITLTYVWVMQNADQSASLHLDLGRLIGAWETREPMAVTTLMGVSFGAGALLASVFFLAWGMSRGSQAAGDALYRGDSRY